MVSNFLFGSSFLSPDAIIVSIGVHGVVCIFKHAPLALGLTLAAFIPGVNGYGGANKKLAPVENIILIQGWNLISLFHI